MKKVEVLPDGLAVRFSVAPDQFQPVKNAVKALQGSWWTQEKKYWKVQNTPSNIARLKELGFELPTELEPIKATPVITPQIAVDFSKLPDILRPYQKEALQFLEARNGWGMLTLAPRMGKSLVALCYAILHKDATPIVICCPASIKINWSREIEKWTKFSYHIVYGTQPYKLPKKDVYIVNYDILHDHMDSFGHIGLLVQDESHRINNTTLSKKGADGKTIKVPVQCTEAFYHIAKQADHIIFLSGTPITSSAKQLFVPLNVFLPEQFSNQYKFQWRYCNPTRNRWGWDFSGLSNGEELFGYLNQIMFRRRREDVFKDLPKESHEFVELEIDQKEYEAELEEFKEWLSKHPSTTEEQIQEKLSKFESLSYSKKRTQIKEWLSDFILSGEKIVLFTWHRTVSEDLYNSFKKQSVLMYGSTSVTERQSAIDKFNEDTSCQIFIGNIQAAKEGITLAAANIAAFIEIPFVPGDLEQAQQRIWLPQKKDPLSYLYFVAKDTVDITRIQSLLKRNQLIGTILDGKENTLFGNSTFVKEMGNQN